MVENLERVATGALTLLIIFVAFAMIIGGKRGARWAINLILFPIKSYAERRIAAIVFVLVAIVVLYFLGINILRR
jgi:uncharacterized membrane protein